MFFLSHYTQINPKINPCKIKFGVEGAVYNALRLMWAIGIGSFVILTSNNIINILVISVRYFGGIKLGTGGLLKAYTNGLLESLKKSILLNVVSGYLITCEFSYENEKKYSYLFKDKNILSKVYQDRCIYTLEVDETFLDSLTNLPDLNITSRVKQLIEDK